MFILEAYALNNQIILLSRYIISGHVKLRLTWKRYNSYKGKFRVFFYFAQQYLASENFNS